MRIISALWQVPLSILSYLFYQVNRKIARFNMNRSDVNHDLMKSNAHVRWQTITEVATTLGKLNPIMMTGPRWNCHAVIGLLTNVYVKEKLTVDVSLLSSTVGEWTCIFYNRDFSVSAYYSSKQKVGLIDMPLPEGFYNVNFRLYHCQEVLKLPSVLVDDGDKIAERDISNEYVNYQKYLTSIANNFTVYYYLNHYYVFNFLRWQGCLSVDFVKRELLPVGNPETKFLYASALKSQRICLTVPLAILSSHSVYITFYNRCSFPVFWGDVLHENFQSQTLVCNGFFLIRVHQKQSGDINTCVENISYKVIDA